MKIQLSPTLVGGDKQINPQYEANEPIPVYDTSASQCVKIQLSPTLVGGDKQINPQYEANEPIPVYDTS
ncbi:hypothetical protein CJ307_35710, partial [Klebsiella quasipneumoniae]